MIDESYQCSDREKMESLLDSLIDPASAFLEGAPKPQMLVKLLTSVYGDHQIDDYGHQNNISHKLLTYQPM